MSSRTLWSVVGAGGLLLALALMGFLLADGPRESSTREVLAAPESTLAAEDAPGARGLRTGGRARALVPVGPPAEPEVAGDAQSQAVPDEQPRRARETALPLPSDLASLKQRIEEVERENRELGQRIADAAGDELRQRAKRGDYEFFPGSELDHEFLRDKICSLEVNSGEGGHRITILPEEEFPREYEWRRRQLELEDEWTSLREEIRRVADGR